MRGNWPLLRNGGSNGMTETQGGMAVVFDRELTKASSAPEAFDVIVIGAGQSGLAMGHRLAQSDVQFVILEALSAVGDVWRRRYDGLTLFTPRTMSALPGLALDGERDGYATREEFGSYLESYARRFNLPVYLDHRVVALEQHGERTFFVRCGNGRTFTAPSVIVATGPFQVPKIPAMAADAPNIGHLIAETFRAAAIRDRSRVLVVGDGASGRDIAAGLSRDHESFLATGKPRKMLPERVFGRSVWQWLRVFGMLSATRKSPIGRFMARADPFPHRGNALKDLARMGVRIRPRLTGLDRSSASFADGSNQQVDVVIWAVGYRNDYSWIRFEMDQGEGSEPVPGLFVIGRPWQFGRRSSLIAGAEPDSNIVSQAVLARHRHQISRHQGADHKHALNRKVS